MTALRVYTAKALILNEKNEILVLWSGEWPERPDRSGKPDFPGGLVEVGETFLDGVVRETTEETGLVVPSKDFTLLYTETKFHEVSQDTVLKSLFVARVNQASVTLSWEHSAYKWLPFDEIVTLEWRQAYRDALDYISSHRLLDEFMV